jgi:2-dehydropantoate 2-reductase
LLSENTVMNICIFGAGAIGISLAARLASQGHHVSAVARGATLAALRNEGLRLIDANGEHACPVQASNDPAQLGAQDLVIVAVKGPALPAVAAGIGPLLHDETMVLSAMNGMPWWFFDGIPGPLANARLESVDPQGALHAAIATRRILGAVVHLAASCPAPGISRIHFGNRLILGEPDHSASPRLDRLAGALRDGGFEVDVTDHIQRDIWFKLWGNMTMNPISALTGATCDRILDDPLVNDYCCAVMAEAAAIGAQIGCPITQTPPERNAMTRKLGAFKTSMLHDAEAGRALEIDALVGAVREIGQHLGLATPNIDALLGLTRLAAQARGLDPVQ